MNGRQSGLTIQNAPKKFANPSLRSNPTGNDEIRVIQREVIYVIGLAESLADGKVNF